MHPVNYMTDFLDVNRKDTYATYSLPPETLSARLMEQYPTLAETKRGKDPGDSGHVRQTVGAVINAMNRSAIAKLEQQQEQKNQLIEGSYWYNPLSLVLNRWNAITATDYYAYKGYREQVQAAIDRQMELLVFEVWEQREVDRASYEDYVRRLQQAK